MTQLNIMCHYETYAREWYLWNLSLALIDKDLVEAEVVNSTNSLFKKLIFNVKDLTFIWLNDWVRHRVPLRNLYQGMVFAKSIDKDLIKAEVVNSTNSRFKKLIFIVKDVTFIWLNDWVRDRVPLWNLCQGMVFVKSITGINW